MKFGRQRQAREINPLDFAYYIANQLYREGAHIDKVIDLPLTTTIRFTMKASAYKQKVQNLVAANLASEPEQKIGQLIQSEPLSNEIWTYEIEFVKAFFADDVRELTA